MPHIASYMEVKIEARKQEKIAKHHFYQQEYINRLPFLSKTTINPEQFPRVKIRALVFSRTCVLGAALTGYDASKPSGNPIVKRIETNYDSLPPF